MIPGGRRPSSGGPSPGRGSSGRGSSGRALVRPDHGGAGLVLALAAGRRLAGEAAPPAVPATMGRGHVLADPVVRHIHGNTMDETGAPAPPAPLMRARTTHRPPASARTPHHCRSLTAPTSSPSVGRPRRRGAPLRHFPYGRGHLTPRTRFRRPRANSRKNGRNTTPEPKRLCTRRHSATTLRKSPLPSRRGSSTERRRGGKPCRSPCAAGPQSVPRRAAKSTSGEKLPERPVPSPSPPQEFVSCPCESPECAPGPRAGGERHVPPTS